MLILPYSTALRLAHPPVVTYGITLLCLMVFWLQLRYPVTETLMYYPQSWNPITMLTATLAHGGWLHLFGNLIFFLAFAPALEILVGSKLRYLSIFLFISIIAGIGYSVSTLVSGTQALPTLGLSGVVMGMIGLSAYLMPKARIKVFWWYIIFWKTFYVPAWILAVIYIGLDIWVMITTTNYHGINVVAHVAGGFAGYAYGYLWLQQRREETREALEDEVEAMKLEQKYGETRSQAFRYRKATEPIQLAKQKAREFDKFMGNIYQCVKTHRDAEAIVSLLTRYDLSTPVAELEAVYKRIEEWGPSRTLLCFGRLIIHLLAEDNRHGRCIVYLEKCQAISPEFVLAQLSQTIFYARFAIETGKYEVAKKMLGNPQDRYGRLVDVEQCYQLLQFVKQQQGHR